VLAATLLAPTPCLAQSDTVPLVIGGHRTPQPNHLELLLELPPGVAKVQPREIQLLEDARATSRADAVNGFREAGWAVSTVLAVDTSRSMTRYLGPVRAALPAYVTKLQPKDTLALVTFDDEVHRVAPLGAPADQMGARIRELKTAGTHTLLHQALDQSLSLFESAAADRTRRRVLIVSDGSDESSGNPSVTDDIIKRAVRLNVAIDAIWLGQPVAARRDTLVRFAERTGGIHRDAIKTESAEADVKAALNDIGAIPTNAVIASFDRLIQTGANTREVGVSLARPGIAAASLALQIPRSVITVPPPISQPTDGTGTRQLVMRWTLRLLPALPAAYGSYFLFFLVAKRRKPEWSLPDPLFWRRHLIVVTPIAPPPSTPAPPSSRRVTMVAPEKPVPGAAIAAGLVLEAVEGPLRGQRITVAGQRFQIGADGNNDLRIPGDKYLSGMHARLELSQGQWMLIDQGSSNGTIVNGRRLTSGQAHSLHNGESVRMGASQFVVMMAPPASPAPPAVGVGSTPKAAPSTDELPR